jgi:NTE family protein
MMPSIENTINAVTDVQLHRNNAAILELVKNSMQRWTNELETRDLDIEPYLIEINFNSLPTTKKRLFFNKIPSDFSLTGEQVEELIRAGRELLIANPEFKRFISQLKKVD